MSGFIPKVFGFLGFVMSANTKNANPKILSLNYMYQVHGQYMSLHVLIMGFSKADNPRRD